MNPIPDSLLHVLDAKDSRAFANYYGPEISKNGLVWVQQLLSMGATQKTFDRLHAFAWFIFVERQGRHFGEPQRFALSPPLEALQELLYQLAVFPTLGVPFDQWSGVLSDSFNQIGEILRENADLKTDPRILKIRESVAKHLETLVRDPKLAAKHSDYLSGAL